MNLPQISMTSTHRDIGQQEGVKSIPSLLTNEQQKVALEIFEVVKISTSILLHCHPSPDPDLHWKKLVKR
jgi:hypothetical protein